MITATGWTWDYIAENMTFPRLLALNEYWAQNPPVHILVKAAIGYKGQETPADEGHPPNQDAALRALLAHGIRTQ